MNLKNLHKAMLQKLPLDQYNLKQIILLRCEMRVSKPGIVVNIDVALPSRAVSKSSGGLRKHFQFNLWDVFVCSGKPVRAQQLW